MSLRARLVLALLALAAIGLVVLDLVSYTALRSYLSDRVDQQVESAIGPAIFAVGNPLEARRLGSESRSPAPAAPQGTQATQEPAPVRRRCWWARRPAAPPRHLRATARQPRPSRPPAALLLRGERPGQARASKPRSRSRVPQPLRGCSPCLLRTAPRPTFAPWPFDVPGSRGTIVVAVPLRELTQTLDRLRTIELIVSGAVLLALGVLGLVGDQGRAAAARADG